MTPTGPASPPTPTDYEPSAIFDQHAQTIYGHQINIAGGLHLTRLDPADRRNQRNHAVLRQAVRRFWIEGVLHSSLYNAVLIRLGLDTRPDAVDNRPWDLILQQPGQPDQPIADDKSLVKIFDDLGQQLLILGEPGSGKTTTLLALAEALLNRTAADPTLPTPVVFNLSSWAEKQPPLADWLVEELNTRYHMPRKVAQTWIANDELLLLLDGLDEVSPHQRENCVAAINFFRQEHVVAIVVCSRTSEYTALTTRLKLVGAVAVRPFTSDQIEDYITRAGPHVAILRQALADSAELRDLAQTPLLLSIMALAYHGHAESNPILQSTNRTTQQFLFDSYIQRMFQHRTLFHPYPLKQTMEWLHWLATQMITYSQTLFFIERLQPEQLEGREQKLLYRLIVMFIVAFSFGLIWGLLFSLAYGVVGALVGGMIIGSSSRLLSGLFGRLDSEIRAHETLNFSWKTGLIFGVSGALAGVLVYEKNAIVFGALLGVLLGGLRNLRSLQHLKKSWRETITDGLMGGLVFGLFGWLLDRLSFGLVFGLFGGLCVGLSGATRSSEAKLRMQPNQGIWLSLRNGLFVTIVGGALGGLAGGLLGVLIASILIGRNGWLGACLKHFVIRCLLYVNQYIPMNYARFLDYAATRLFLRKVGGGYVFVHRLLLEHFAALTDEDIARITTGVKST